MSNGLDDLLVVGAGLEPGLAGGRRDLELVAEVPDADLLAREVGRTR